MLGRFCGYTKGAEIYAGRKEIQGAVWESVSSAERADFTSPALEYKWKDLGGIYLSFCGRTREY